MSNWGTRLNCTKRTYNILKVDIKRTIYRTIVNAARCNQLLGRNADPKGVWDGWVIHVVEKEQTLSGLTRRDLRIVHIKYQREKIPVQTQSQIVNIRRNMVSRAYCWSPWNIACLLEEPPRPEFAICTKKENISVASENTAYGRNNVGATRIFNMDKFAVSTAPKPEILLAPNGKQETV